MNDNGADMAPLVELFEEDTTLDIHLMSGPNEVFIKTLTQLQLLGQKRVGDTKQLKKPKKGQHGISKPQCQS